MTASTATAKTPLRQGWVQLTVPSWAISSQTASRYCLETGSVVRKELRTATDPTRRHGEGCQALGLRTPIYPRVLAVSSLDRTRDPELAEEARTVLNNVG